MRRVALPDGWYDLGIHNRFDGLAIAWSCYVLNGEIWSLERGNAKICNVTHTINNNYGHLPHDQEEEFQRKMETMWGVSIQSILLGKYKDQWEQDLIVEI